MAYDNHKQAAANDDGLRGLRALIGAGAGGLLGGGLGAGAGLLKATFLEPAEKAQYLRRALQGLAIGGLAGSGIGAGIGASETGKDIQTALEGAADKALSSMEMQMKMDLLKGESTGGLRFRKSSADYSALQQHLMEKLAAAPAWQRSEGKNEEGGLNAKGRASYKKETGGTLKPPVSSDAAKKSPAKAKRRKSFCARMCGHKRKNTSAETARDPDSRVNKALRKWDCHCS